MKRLFSASPRVASQRARRRPMWLGLMGRSHDDWAAVGIGAPSHPLEKTNPASFLSNGGAIVELSTLRWRFLAYAPAKQEPSKAMPRGPKGVHGRDDNQHH
jgi:hypothetical protein